MDLPRKRHSLPSRQPSYQRGPDAVRYMFVDPATQRPTAVQGDTAGQRKTARLAENPS